MGMVFKQSVKNLVSTYLGFAIGAVNTLFLFTYFLSKSEYGLVGYVLSTATILSPLIAFGVHNTFIRFYSSYNDKNEQSKFNLMLFLLPFAVIIPFTLVGVLTYQTLVHWLSATNAIVGDYVFLIFITAITMGYFEIAYAWARVQLKTVAGNFLKEVFNRFGILILLLGIYFKWLTFEQLMYGVFWVYLLRMLVMFVVAFGIEKPTFQLGLPENKKEIFWYSLFIILSGSVASLLMDIDKFMINQYLPISEIAIYNVAVFTATVIAIPYRAMYQIVSPLTAQFINKNKPGEMADLYKRSTINVFLTSVFIFVLIVTNAKQMYALLPDDAYATGLWVLILIALVKLSDALVGINNAILFNSKHYRTVLYFGVFLVLAMVGLNLWLIPLYGIDGAAIATLTAFLSYNVLKLIFVLIKFNLHPFYKEVWKIIFVGLLATVLFFVWDFSFHPLLNILLKSLLISVLFLISAYFFHLSEDLMTLLKAKFGVRK